MQVDAALDETNQAAVASLFKVGYSVLPCMVELGLQSACLKQHPRGLPA